MWTDCTSHILEEWFILCSDSVYLDLEEMAFKNYGENIIFAMNYPPWKSVIQNNINQLVSFEKCLSLDSGGFSRKVITTAPGKTPNQQHWENL